MLAPSYGAGPWDTIPRVTHAPSTEHPGEHLDGRTGIQSTSAPFLVALLARLQQLATVASAQGPLFDHQTVEHRPHTLRALASAFTPSPSHSLSPIRVNQSKSKAISSPSRSHLSSPGQRDEPELKSAFSTSSSGSVSPFGSSQCSLQGRGAESPISHRSRAEAEISRGRKQNVKPLWQKMEPGDTAA